MKLALRLQTAYRHRKKQPGNVYKFTVVVSNCCCQSGSSLFSPGGRSWRSVFVDTCASCGRSLVTFDTWRLA